MENIAKLTSYGCYLDCDFATAKYPDDKIHIVGLLAEYVYDLEQRILHYDERYVKLWHEIETLRECVSKESDQEQKISDLEAKLAESENKLNQYPYKNDVIEKQYEDLKEGIKFRIENNITDDWEQLYHCIDVLCEKHKTRIRDIEDGIYRIEQLEQQLAEKEKEIDVCRKYIKQLDQDKISFCIEQLEKVKNRIESKVESVYKRLDDLNIKIVCESTSRQLGTYEEIVKEIDNQIKQLKEIK